MQSGMNSVTIWPEVVDKGQFGRVFTPQSQDIVFPSNHLAKNEHDRDCRKANQQEKWVRSLHHIKAFFVAQHLKKQSKKHTIIYKQKITNSQVHNGESSDDSHSKNVLICYITQTHNIGTMQFRQPYFRNLNIEQTQIYGFLQTHNAGIM